jgi:alpha-D-ribose 1-methylphosphonate 5-triphosphate synthase subunit PhnH
MDALAKPGTVHKLAEPALTRAPLSGGLASVLLTLSDPETPIWLCDTLRQDASVAAFIAFHTGAPMLREPGKAAFVVASDANELPRFEQFNLGTQDYPDRSTTIVLAVAALSGGAALSLRGPGIKGHGHISPIGLPEDFIGQWAANRELFPRGIDLLLVADGAVLGLPRSTRIAEGH